MVSELCSYTYKIDWTKDPHSASHHSTAWALFYAHATRVRTSVNKSVMLCGIVQKGCKRTFSVYISTQLVGNYYWTGPIMFVPCCLHHTHYLEVGMLVCMSCAAVSLRLGPSSLLPVWVWQQAQTGKYSRNLSQAAEYSSSLGHHHPTTLQCWFLLTLSDCAKWVAAWEGVMLGWGVSGMKA